MIFNPSKLFPCDCMGEGITITPYMDAEDISENEVLMSEDKKLRDCKESPFIQFSFWQYGVSTKPRWNRWWRLKIAWYVFWAGSAWPDMVIMTAAHAKNFANHILYTISKAEKEMKLEVKDLPNVDTLVAMNLIQDEQPSADDRYDRSLFCVQHGGPLVIGSNKNGCPKCKQLLDLGIDDEGNKLDEEELPHAMFCVQHGGSPACEESNKKYGFDCPKCKQLLNLGIKTRRRR